MESNQHRNFRKNGQRDYKISESKIFETYNVKLRKMSAVAINTKIFSNKEKHLFVLEIMPLFPMRIEKTLFTIFTN